MLTSFMNDGDKKDLFVELQNVIFFLRDRCDLDI
jgi:hypothetical protein